MMTVVTGLLGVLLSVRAASAGSVGLAPEGPQQKNVAVVNLAKASVHFSSPPTDREFFMSGIFAEPLVPVGKTSPTDSNALAAALGDYVRSRDASALVRFTEDHPRSVWTPALLPKANWLHCYSPRLTA